MSGVGLCFSPVRASETDLGNKGGGGNAEKKREEKVTNYYYASPRFASARDKTQLRNVHKQASKQTS